MLINSCCGKNDHLTWLQLLYYTVIKHLKNPVIHIKKYIYFVYTPLNTYAINLTQLYTEKNFWMLKVSPDKLDKIKIN